MLNFFKKNLCLFNFDNDDKSPKNKSLQRTFNRKKKI